MPLVKGTKIQATKIEKKILEMLQENKKMLGEIELFIQRMDKKIWSFAAKSDEAQREIFQIIKGHENYLDTLKKQNETLDETVCNVLLAIRQNEYVQAWYPNKAG